MPAGQSVKDHLLANYLNSLLTVVLNQFNQKRLRGGMKVRTARRHLQPRHGPSLVVPP